MVSTGQVIIDGFWNTDDDDIINTHFLNKFRNLVAGIHGVIASIDKDVLDAIFL